MINAKQLPDLSILNHVFDYDPESGVLYWKNPTSKRVRAGCEAGTLHKPSGRLQVQISGSIYKVSRVVFYMHYGRQPKGVVDHVDHDTLNNRPDNLRDATMSQNGMNKSMQSNNTSGYKGVSFHAGRGEFIAYAKVNGKMVFGGWHKSAIDAAYSAANLREKLHGEFVYHG